MTVTVLEMFWADGFVMPLSRQLIFLSSIKTSVTFRGNMRTLRGWILKVDFAVLFVQMRKDTINVQSRG